MSYCIMNTPDSFPRHPELAKCEKEGFSERSERVAKYNRLLKLTNKPF